MEYEKVKRKETKSNYILYKVVTELILHDVAVHYLEVLCDAGMLLLSMSKS